MGETLLIIEYGASATTAIIVGPDGPTAPVLFDGTAWLTSKVTLDSKGQPAVATSPGHLEVVVPASVLRQPQVPLAGKNFDPADLVAATLAQVMVHAQGQHPDTFTQVVILVPARYGPGWRSALRRSALRAGFVSPRITESATAIAAGLTTRGAYLSHGQLLAICELGASATEVVIVERAGDNFAIAAIADTADISGDHLDQILVQHLHGQPAEAMTASDARIAGVAARDARNMLSTVATVHLPAHGPLPAVTIDQQVLRELAAPMWLPVANLIRQAAQQADTTPAALHGVYLHGGGAQLPGAAEQIRHHLGATVIAITDPQQTAADGATAALETPTRAAARTSTPAWTWGRIIGRDLINAMLTLIASLALFGYTLAGTTVYPAQLYTPAVVVTSWSAYGLTALLSTLGCAALGQMIATGLIEDADSADGARRRAQIITGAVLAGIAMSVVYAMIANNVIGVKNTPLLTISFWSAVPSALLIVAAVHLRRWHTPPSSPQWLPPTSSGLCAAIGSIAVTAGLTGAMPWLATGDTWWTFLLLIGGAFSGAAYGLLLARKPLTRLYLAAVAAIIGMAIAGMQTRDTIGYLYITATTLWLLIHTAYRYLPAVTRQMLAKTHTRPPST